MRVVNVTNISKFMGLLFNTETFDSILVAKVSISTYATFDIDGHTNKDFFDRDEDTPADYVTWGTLRPICRDLIKGDRPPVKMSIIGIIPPEKTNQILSNEGYSTEAGRISFLVNIKYSDASAVITSATSVNTFIPDKSYERIWDGYFERYVNRYPIFSIADL